MNSLENKVCIITGGTSGIGEASVRCFAKAGATVVFTGRNKEQGMKIERQERQAGLEVEYVKCDSANKSELEDVVKYTVQQYKKLDVLFNNAGLFHTGDLENYSLEEWNEIFSVNVTACFNLVKAALPHLKKAKGNILINASVAGMQSYAKGKSFSYSASKSAVIQFSRMLALNYGKDVRTNCICPGIVDTPMFKGDDISIYNDRIPVGYVAKPEQVAKVACFMVSDDAEYLNGVVLPVDGGASL